MSPPSTQALEALATSAHSKVALPLTHTMPIISEAQWFPGLILPGTPLNLLWNVI